MRSLLASMLLAAAACSGGTATAPTSGGSNSDLDLGGLGKSHAMPPPTPDAAVASGSGSAAPVAPVASTAGVSFREEAQLLYRIAACGGADAERIPESRGDAIARDKLAKVAERHCQNVLKRMAEFRAAYFEKHKSWFDDNIPKDIPKTVVYPFGGGDLLSALVAFPDATEITTISLELAGDPRRIKTLKPDQLGNSLAALRVEIGGLLSVGSNTSVNLSAQQRNDIPGQVASHLMGLVTAGYEPTDMKYFRLDDSGGIQYLEQGDVEDADKKRMKALKGDWASPTFSEAFSHVEIRYKKQGETTERVFRHFGWNLDDTNLTARPQLLKHLAAKGKVTMLTKGASYLLHRPTFSKIRQYMLDHLTWMLSDSTGIPPLYAQPANMVQETYGTYSGAFLEGSRGTRADRTFVDLWRSNSRKKLGFRFGYVDASGSGHLVVTRPK
ncbi:MAG: hypothetical protein H0V17_25520 [Deltaproteobacteria bacterium]|nr:hypothetical protein [Deltaproteobacteria bacterium]